MIEKIALDTIDSTNAEAFRRLSAGAASPFWVTARRQTQGKGRRGRPWVAAEGNFFGSLCLTVADPQSAAQRSFVAALALADTVEALGVDPAAVSLKWPNDVLLSGGKLAGILLESTLVAGQVALVIGIGVNLAQIPVVEQLEPGAVSPVSLSDHGVDIAPGRFLGHLAAAYEARESQFINQGFAATRAAWMARAARIGKPVIARLPGREVHGRFVEVDETGALVLDTGRGTEHLPAADVYF